VYALAVGYLSSFFRASDNVLIGLAATGLVAVMFEPLRARLQHAVDRLLYGEREAPYRALARLGEQLQSTLAADDVFRHVVATVHDALGRPAYAALELQGTDGAATAAAATGVPTTDAEHIELVYRGERVGRLVVGGYDGDRKLLEGAATHAAAAVHAVQLAERLQHTREQLVLAREEERRRLRHDLHDELAPTLAGLALTAATAGDLLERDLGAARRLVGELQTALRTSVADVRRLAHDLRPPVLDELGLLAALHERAHQFETGALRVEVQAPAALPRLPAAVEVAAYRIGSEALLNVVRHAQATCCSVRLAACDARLRLEVLDDGIGIRDGAVAGVGLRSMRERALELGGTLSIDARPEGGTRVVAELPVGVADA
jgi:signal transduction histidine kinase